LIDDDWRSPAVREADARVYRLIEDIKQINLKNSRLLDRYSERLEECTAEFARRVNDLGVKLAAASVAVKS
jgi:flagellar biosynthesis/type III secretory pathway chaperone